MPADATAVVVNLTVTATSAALYLCRPVCACRRAGNAFPSERHPRLVPDQTIADFAIVPIGPGGDIYYLLRQNYFARKSRCENGPDQDTWVVRALALGAECGHDGQ